MSSESHYRNCCRACQWESVKIPPPPADNSPADQPSSPAVRAGVARRVERLSVPKPDDPQETMIVEPNRLRLIRERLQHNFYETGAPSDRIATAVLVAVQDLDKVTLRH
jgi:hypothetical protein